MLDFGDNNSEIMQLTDGEIDLVSGAGRVSNGIGLGVSVVTGVALNNAGANGYESGLAGAHVGHVTSTVLDFASSGGGSPGSGT